MFDLAPLEENDVNDLHNLRSIVEGFGKVCWKIMCDQWSGNIFGKILSKIDQPKFWKSTLSKNPRLKHWESLKKIFLKIYSNKFL